MKKTIIAMLAILLLLFAAGCQDKPSDKADDAQPATEAVTEAPYIPTPISEPEWTLAEGNLQLEDQSSVYAESEDILYFAIVTNNDDTQELRFKLNEETTEMLKKQSADNKYYMTLDGSVIGDAVLNEDCTEVIVSQENAVGDITAIASKIRGLSEE